LSVSTIFYAVKADSFVAPKSIDRRNQISTSDIANELKDPEEIRLSASIRSNQNI
jgi:hypothetical protein